jgi:hypothetical protein
VLERGSCPTIIDPDVIVAAVFNPLWYMMQSYPIDTKVLAIIEVVVFAILEGKRYEGYKKTGEVGRQCGSVAAAAAALSVCTQHQQQATTAPLQQARAVTTSHVLMPTLNSTCASSLWCRQPPPASGCVIGACGLLCARLIRACEGHIDVSVQGLVVL